jgi:hypothetical protein
MLQYFLQFRVLFETPSKIPCSCFNILSLSIFCKYALIYCNSSGKSDFQRLSQVWFGFCYLVIQRIDNLSEGREDARHVSLSTK